MAGVLRTQLLRRVFGDGPGGVAGAAVASWGLSKVAEGIRRDEQVLDVSKLRVGETYTIVTRPAPTRRERKLAKRARRADRKATAATKPHRAQRRTAARLEKVQRRAAKADPTSTRGAKLAAAERDLEMRYQRLSAHTPKQRQLLARREAWVSALEAERAASLAKARRKARPPRRKVWRDR